MVTQFSEDKSAPIYMANGFRCPHCRTYAQQSWSILLTEGMPSGTTQNGGPADQVAANSCARCKKFCIWVNQTLLYPLSSTAPMPVPDMPEDVQKDYLEARSVFDRSPKSAAALLRLSLQKLMVDLGERGENLNTDIGNLVRKGLPVKVQQALDAVRVIGNNAVHPGQIDLDDNKETTAALFGLVNFVIERMITQPREIEAIYTALPQSSREAIERRDGNPVGP